MDISITDSIKDFFDKSFWQQFISGLSLVTIGIWFGSKRLKQIFRPPKLELVFENDQKAIEAKVVNSQNDFDCTAVLKVKSNAYISSKDSFLSFTITREFNRPSGHNVNPREDTINNSLYFEDIPLGTIFEGVNSIGDVPELKLRINSPDKEFYSIPWKVKSEGLSFEGELNVRIVR